MVRIAIIGCGRIVEEAHAPSFLQLTDRAKVVAIADSAPGRLKTIGDMLGVPEKSCYTDYMELLGNEQVQIVDLALPHFLHEKVTIDCARAKVDVISEKPLAPSLEAADNILAAVTRNKVRLGVLHNYLYRPMFVKTVELIRAGAIGRPFLFRNEQLHGAPWPGVKEYDPGWRANSNRSGAGCLLDNGYHNIYLANAMLDSPVVRVFARISTYLHKIDVEDTSLLLMEHENGSSSSIQNSWSVKSAPPWVFEVHGTEGSIVYDVGKKQLGLYKHSTNDWEYFPLERGSWSLEFVPAFRAYLDNYENGLEFPINGQEARKNLEVIMAAYRSSKSGQNVSIT